MECSSSRPFAGSPRKKIGRKAASTAQSLVRCPTGISSAPLLWLAQVVQPAQEVAIRLTCALHAGYGRSRNSIFKGLYRDHIGL